MAGTPKDLPVNGSHAMPASQPSAVEPEPAPKAGSPARLLIGRDQELSRLNEFIRARSPGALVLTGEPGVGKTILWEAGVVAAQEHGLRVLLARPTGAEAQLSFAALADLLDGVDLTALAGIPVPQIRALDVALLRAEPTGAAPEPRAISAGFLNALRDLAGRDSLLVAVDDVPSLDTPSAEALSFAARRLLDHPVRFLLTRRSGPASSFERALDPIGVERLEVGPLSLGAIRLLLSERLGLALPRRILRRVSETSRGNPLFALEFGRVLIEHGIPPIGEEMPVPEVVEDLFGPRMAGLPPRIRRLLLGVALSSDLRLPQLAALGGAAAVDDALSRGLLTEEGGRVRAAHPLLAGAALSRASAGERRRMHLRLARVVDDEVLRGRHLAMSTPVPETEMAATLASAAATARARGAAEEAVELAEHALRLTPMGSEERTDRFLLLGEYLLQAGEHQRATALLTPEVLQLPSASHRARALLLLADSRGSRVDEIGSHLERALAESEGDPALRAVVTARRIRYVVVGRVQRVREAEAWGVVALRAAREVGPDVEREVLHGLGWARSLRGRSIEDLSKRYGAITKDTSHLYRSIDRIEADRLAWRGEVTEARPMLTRLLAIAEERGEAWSYVLLRLQLCEVELRAGEWERASYLLDDWDPSSEGELLAPAAYQRCRGLIAVGRGEPEEAERWAAEAIAGAETRGLRWDVFEALRVRGIASLFVGQPDRAIESLWPVWQHAEHEGVDEPGVFPVAPDLVEALTSRGRIDDAVAVIDRLERLAIDQQHPWGLATTKRCRAHVGFASTDEDATGLMEEAAGAYERLGLRFDHARSLLSLGRAQRRLKQWGGSRRWLEEAANSFEAMGSGGWAALARGELDRLPARRPGRRGELTPTENRVAALAAEGLSNSEIARTLFVSVHTVEAHLAHTFVKLGIRSRSQLAQHLTKPQ